MRKGGTSRGELREAMDDAARRGAPIQTIGVPGEKHPHQNGTRIASGNIMEFTRADLTNTTEAVKLLLAELDLNEYRFTFEPRDVGSQVRVEYAATDGWRSTTLPVDEAALLASREDRAARRVLSGEWRERLIHAKRRTGTTDES